ncbi:LysR substrate-binding domain-containing protein [Opitutus terrae]|uniref:Transcriptional regulator, LysR family n=1 Tax=Opitutus terrae (strain DSM 11246 / JCM 15787 / PB90-1) TaxID=452637 RepID=B1ZQE5_OPITP|nr:LysR substrate-binding domain-containing protein [Opitutus terrae]ACB73625.1 transcriptional regulator, LysR family [Opitutus terrae PB90-1]
MELRHLRYFCAVAETLHFSRAAERLHVTQPALSRQIRDLEAELGVTLLRRHHTATVLTPAGEAFLRRAREILAAAGEAVSEARQAGRQLRFGHYGTLWTECFGPALRRFAKQHPGCALQPIELMPVELVAALRRQELDIALIGTVTRALQREFATQPLCTLEMQLALAADHPLAKRRLLALADLRDADWIAWDEAGFPGRAELLRDAARAAGFAPRIVGTVDSVASMFVAVATSRAVGCVLPMSRKLPHSGVVFARLRPPGIPFTMHAAWARDSRQAPLLAALATALSKVN